MSNTHFHPLELEVHEPGLLNLLDLLDPDTALEQIVTGLQFTEGPVWDTASGTLIFSDIVGNTLYRWGRDDGLRVFRQPSNMANGNTFDHKHRLLTCEHATSCVTRTALDGTIEVLASHYNGQELNSPNDIVEHSGGALFFTDPMSGRSARYGVERASQLGFQGVYRLDPATGALTLLVADFVLPNGLCFSLDERQLFVNDTRRNHIRVFDVGDDGALAGGQVWAALNGDGDGAPDGMKLDQRGNVWCTGPGGIHVFGPDAAHLGVVRLPERVANLAWGDADGRTLYMTASTSVYAVRTNVAGQRTAA